MRITSISMRPDCRRTLTLSFILCALWSAAAFGAPAAATLIGKPIATLGLTDGRVLHNVVIVGFSSTAVMARWDGGRGTIMFDVLPADVRSLVEQSQHPSPVPEAATTVVADGKLDGSAGGYSSALVRARRGFSTRLLKLEQEGYPPDIPPTGVLELVSYPGPLGKMAAYISTPKGDGVQRPAIIWLVGGASGSISPVAWETAPSDNDQSASAFRGFGIIMMYPSLRGGNTNPGHHERFYGEVDDVIAAARYLARLPGVDPHRIYLGGHSTGGTLALLVAESTDMFRSVFALGPSGDMDNYVIRPDCPFDPNNPKEQQLRSPKLWLDSIKVPTFVYEGTESPSNIGYLQEMTGLNHNPLVTFTPLSGTHFSIIARVVPKIAKQILDAKGS
jgi:hypothetical protein